MVVEGQGGLSGRCQVRCTRAQPPVANSMAMSSAASERAMTWKDWRCSGWPAATSSRSSFAMASRCRCSVGPPPRRSHHGSTNTGCSFTEPSLRSHTPDQLCGSRFVPHLIRYRIRSRFSWRAWAGVRSPSVTAARACSRVGHRRQPPGHGVSRTTLDEGAWAERPAADGMLVTSAVPDFSGLRACVRLRLIQNRPSLPDVRRLPDAEQECC